MTEISTPAGAIDEHTGPLLDVGGVTVRPLVMGKVTVLQLTICPGQAPAARTMPSARSTFFLHDFHGAGTRCEPQATAFALRRDHFVALAASGWQPGDGPAAARARAWTRQVTERLAPMALPGGDVNFLAPHETDRVRSFDGIDVDRRTQIRDRVDPRGVFTAATGRF